MESEQLELPPLNLFQILWPKMWPLLFLNSVNGEPPAHRVNIQTAEEVHAAFSEGEGTILFSSDGSFPIILLMETDIDSCYVKFIFTLKGTLYRLRGSRSLVMSFSQTRAMQGLVFLYSSSSALNFKCESGSTNQNSWECI